MKTNYYIQESEINEIKRALQIRIDNLKILEKHQDELTDEQCTWLKPAYTKRLSLPNAKTNSVALLKAINDLPNNAFVFSQTQDEIIEKREDEDYEQIINETFDILLAYQSINNDTIFFVYSQPYTYTEKEMEIILRARELI